LKFVNFPFNPKRFPFFYGWIIVVVATIGILFSVPGQTMGVSVFTDYLIGALDITREQLSFAYLIGTLLSSFCLTQAGRWYDRYGARVMMVIAPVLLSLSLFLMSRSESIIDAVRGLVGGEGQGVAVVAAIALLFFLLRFSGQGMMTSFSRTTIMKWFDQKRGLANGISTVFVGIGFSLAPLFFKAQIDKHLWQGAYLYISLFILLFVILAFVFVRDTPERCGLLPDGKRLEPTRDFKKTAETRVQFDLKMSKRTRALWIIVFSLSFYSFFYSGLTFHIVEIFKSIGLSSTKALSVFIPATVVSVTISMSASIISDYIRLRVLFYIYAVGCIISSIGLAFLNDGFFYYVLILGIGIISGMYNVVLTLSLPRYFGRNNLGTINGFVMSIVVFSSALAPFGFSMFNKWFGNFSNAGLLCGVFALIQLGTIYFLKSPQSE
jgi:OFA family oxalate/formate antiporter-like MFS transporter